MFTGATYTVDPFISSSTIDSSLTTGFFDLSEASEAVAEDAFIHSPTRSLYELARNQNVTGEDEGLQLSQEDLTAKKETDFYAQYMTMPEEGMSERAYKIAYQAKRAEKLRDNAMRRAPDTIGQYLKTLGVSLGTSMLDPTSIALGYLPAAIARGGYLGATAARSLGKFDDAMDAGSALERTGLRAQAGAAGGLFEGGVAEAPIYFAANERGEKYGANDVFMSITAGVVVGTGIQVTGGALFDLATVQSRAFDREKTRVTKEIELQKAADIETDIKLKAEKQAEADAYRKEVADSKATPENLKKYEDPEFTGPIPLGDLEDIMLNAFLRASDTGGIQRKLSEYTIEERGALMQSGLAQFIQGRQVLGNEFVETFEARRLGDRYRPEDIEQVREEVEREVLQRQADDLQEMKLTPEEFKSGQTIDNKINAQIKEVKGIIKNEETVKTKGLRGKELKAAQKKLSEQQARLKEAHLKLRVLESGLKGVKKVDADAARRVRELELQQRRIKDDDFPSETTRAINTEVERRMAIIDEIHLSKPEYSMGKQTQLATGIKDSFKTIHRKASSPESLRSYRPEVEAEFTVSGRRTKPSEESQKYEQEKTDAIENANLLAKENDAEYKITEQETKLLNDMEQMKTSAERLATCMSRVA